MTIDLHKLGETSQRPNEDKAYADDTTTNGTTPTSLSNILKDLTALDCRISIRNAAYAWTASGSGTAEYYLTTAAGTTPGISTSPGDVLENSEVMTSGTVGSLTASTWDYGDNDTLGYSTIYVRIADDTDPDTKEPTYIQYTPEAVDISSSSLTGSASDSSGIVTSQVVTGLSDGRLYRLIWRYTLSSNILEDYLDITCEQEG